MIGAWNRTSREKLYEELGWESIGLHLWSRRLILSCKFVYNITPDRIGYPITKLQALYSLRRPDIIGQINTRTTNFMSSFHPHCLSEWNKLHPDIRSTPSLSIFKTKLLKCIRPAPQLIYGIHNPEGLAILTQMRVSLRKLNFHKFRLTFRVTVKPLCPANDGLRIQNISCCTAILIRCLGQIFSTVVVQHCYPMGFPLAQMKFYSDICYMATRV